MAARVVVVAAVLTPCLIGVRVLVERLLGVDLWSSLVTIFVPIAIVIEISVAHREGRPSRVLGE